MATGVRRRTAVVVVGTDERRWLGPCLSSVLRSGTPLVIYVDNASADGSAAFVRERFPQVIVLELPVNGGYTTANNAGMERALQDGAAYVFLVNPDTRTPTRLVPQLERFMDEHPDYGIVGPLQVEYDAHAGVDEPRPLNSWSRIALENGERNVFHDDAPRHRSHASPAAGRAAGTLEHAYVQGAALFARLEAVRDAGFLDPLYHTYYEETDLCRRVRWCGYRVALLLDATIQHKGGGSAAVSEYRTYHMLRNRFLFALTDPTWTPAELVRVCAIWWGQIVAMTLRLRRDAAFAPTPAIAARIAGWLVLHAADVVRRRRRNARLALG